MSNIFKYVIIIAGNHEYYFNEYHKTNKLIKSIANGITKKNVFFLQQNTLELDDVLPNIRILGCTMWVNYKTKATKKYLKVVNDFQRIKYSDKGITDIKADIDSDSDSDTNDNNDYITPKLVNKLHEKDVKWLNIELNKAKNDKKNVIILTHHAPSDFACVDNAFIKYPIAYSTNYESMEYLFNKPVIGWFFGHTHRNTDIMVSNNNWLCRIASNQQGYIYKQKSKYYMSSKVIHFPNNIDTSKNIVKFNKTIDPHNSFVNIDGKNALQTTLIMYNELKKEIKNKNKYVPKDDRESCNIM
mmetsp:Transcript_18287/g.22470  ORF Transcript_18287/g.22470 Transcript_18287/m.22470 type:complete len:300 (-) Transcript_18287:108-1007(-)